MKFLAILAVCVVPAVAAAQSNSQAEVALAKNVLDELQILSFAQDREYCGYLAYDEAGSLRATPPTRGLRDSCEADFPPDAWVPFASYHTHGAFDADVPAEFPSVSDLEADEAEGTDGYVATPGGRVWFVDSNDMEVSQLCGIGCLRQDPKFISGLDGKIAQSYTYRQLLDIEAQ